MTMAEMKANKYVWFVAGLALGLAGGYVMWGMNKAPAGGNAAA